MRENRYGDRLAIPREIDHVTIMPRGLFAGRTCSRLLRPDTCTREEVENHVAAVLAGRAADEAWGKATTRSGGGDGSDLAAATSLLAALQAAWCLGGTLVHRASSPAQALDLARADPDLRDKVENHLQGFYVRAGRSLPNTTLSMLAGHRRLRADPCRIGR